MAIQLINQLTTEFDISKYKDTYSSKLLKVIQDKAKGKKVTPAPLRVVNSRGRDLMEQLKASLETPGKRRAS
jgi:DNA end-binding protein Ku